MSRYSVEAQLALAAEIDDAAVAVKALTADGAVWTDATGDELGRHAVRGLAALAQLAADALLR